MGQIKKIDNMYYVEFVARGLLYQQKAGESYTQAQDMLADIEQKIAQGEVLTIPRRIPLKNFISMFEDFIQTEYGSSYLRHYQSIHVLFLDYIRAQNPGIEFISDITPRVIGGFRIFLQNHYKQKCIEFSLILLRDLFNYGIKLSFINDNPTLHIKLTNRLTFLNYPQTKRLLLAQKLLNHNLALAHVAYELGIKNLGRIAYFVFSTPRKRNDLDFD